jgi:hypothetical protein
LALNDLGFNEKQYFLAEKEIKNEKEAKLWKLAGSPTIRVNGVDIEESHPDYGLFPREYDNNSYAPPVKRIKDSLRMDIRERAGIAVGKSALHDKYITQGARAFSLIK